MTDGPSGRWLAHPMAVAERRQRPALRRFRRGAAPLPPIEPEWVDGEEVYTVYRPAERTPTMQRELLAVRGTTAVMVIRRHRLLVAGRWSVASAALFVGARPARRPDDGLVPGRDASDARPTVAGPVLAAGAAHVGDLTPAQLANAGAIISEGRRRGVPARAS